MGRIGGDISDKMGSRGVKRAKGTLAAIESTAKPVLVPDVHGAGSLSFEVVRRRSGKEGGGDPESASLNKISQM